MGLKGDYDNRVGKLGSAFYLALVFNGWVRIGDYINAHGLVAMVRTTE